MLFVDQLVEFRVFVLDARADTGTVILIVNRVGIRSGAADVLNWQLTAIDPIFAPEYDELL